MEVIYINPIFIGMAAHTTARLERGTTDWKDLALALVFGVMPWWALYFLIKGATG